MDSWCPWDHIWAILSLAVELTGHSEDLNKASDEKFQLGGQFLTDQNMGPLGPLTILNFMEQHHEFCIPISTIEPRLAY
jgi:hypothetical protein